MSIVDCCWWLHARWFSVHSVAFMVVANSHGEELVSESLGLKWVGLVSLVAVSGFDRWGWTMCSRIVGTACMESHCIMYVWRIIWMDVFQYYTCVCVGIGYEYELCWYWVCHLSWCAVTECVIRLGWLMCYLLSITWWFIMLIISIEELTLTTMFQVTSSDWVEASAWSLV